AVDIPERALVWVVVESESLADLRVSLLSIGADLCSRMLKLELSGCDGSADDMAGVMSSLPSLRELGVRATRFRDWQWLSAAPESMELLVAAPRDSSSALARHLGSASGLRWVCLKLDA